MDAEAKSRHRGRRITRVVLVVCAVILAALLIGPLLVPVLPARDTVDPRELSYAESKFLDVGGVRYHYTEYGSRDATCTLVLMHGFGANTASWRSVAPLLGEECRVVAFDRPGFGLTERPRRAGWGDTNPYSIDAHAEQTIALMDALGIERATLVGHSAGATVAALAAARYPNRVDGLVLEAPAVYETRTLGWLAPLLRSPQGRRVGPLLVRRWARPTAERLLARAHYDPSVVTTQLADGYFRPFRAIDWDRGLWEFAIAPRSEEAVEVLDGLSERTLVIAGRQDAIVPYDNSVRVSRAVPDAVLITYERTGHVPHEERPARFASDVLEFVRDSAGSSGE